MGEVVAKTDVRVGTMVDYNYSADGQYYIVNNIRAIHYFRENAVDYEYRLEHLTKGTLTGWVPRSTFTMKN